MMYMVLGAKFRRKSFNSHLLDGIFMKRVNPTKRERM